MRPVVDGLYRRALLILRDEADALDAIQECLLHAWRALPALRDADRFEAWLDRILVNACRDALRRRGARRVREIRPTVDPETQEWIEIAPDSSVIDDDRRGAIVRAFHRLDVADRSILILHYVEARPLADIALTLGIPTGTVKSRLYTARKRLGRVLGRELR